MELKCEDAAATLVAKLFADGTVRKLKFSDEDRLVLRDLVDISLVVSGTVLVSKQLWKFVGGNNRMPYSRFKTLATLIYSRVCPAPLPINSAMV